MKPETRRWLLLAVAMMATMCQGISYTASNFKRVVMGLLSGYGGKPVTDADWGLAFSMGFALLPVGMWLGGRLADRNRVGTALALGAAMTGGGLALAGSSTSIGMFTLGFGALLSLGCGFSYGTCIGAAVRWFPDRRGLASGLTVAALGIGGMVLVPFQNFLLARVDNPMNMFHILAAVLFAVIALAACVVRNPPAGFCPEGWTPPPAPLGGTPASAEGLHWTGMVRSRRFWLLFAAYFAGTFPGMLVISDARGLVDYIISPGARMFGDVPVAPAALATLTVSLWGFANAVGRIGWGVVSDRKGRPWALRGMYLAGAWAVVLLAALAMAAAGLAERGSESGGTWAVTLVVAVGICFGGVLGTFPAVCTEAFGTKHAATNYSVMFWAFALSALAAPQAAAWYRLPEGGMDYARAVMPGAWVAVVGAALAVWLFRTGRRKVGSEQ